MPPHRPEPDAKVELAEVEGVGFTDVVVLVEVSVTDPFANTVDVEVKEHSQAVEHISNRALDRGSVTYYAY